MSEEKKKPVLRVKRSWSIDINDDVYVEPSEHSSDSISFLSTEEDDTVLFSMTYDVFEELYETVKSERTRMQAIDAEDEKKS